jgi:hypothetical protein
MKTKKSACGAKQASFALRSNQCRRSVPDAIRVIDLWLRKRGRVEPKLNRSILPLRSARQSRRVNGKLTPSPCPQIWAAEARGHRGAASRTRLNLPQQSQSSRCVGEGALLSSRLRYSQSFCALHDRTAILHLLVGRKTSLMNLDHGLLKRAPQIFRRGRAVRLNLLGLKMVWLNMLNMLCFNTGDSTLVCHWRGLNFLSALSAL